VLTCYFCAWMTYLLLPRQTISAYICIRTTGAPSLYVEFIYSFVSLETLSSDIVNLLCMINCAGVI